MYCDHPVCSPIIGEEHNEILLVETGQEEYDFDQTDHEVAEEKTEPEVDTRKQDDMQAENDQVEP